MKSFKLLLFFALGLVLFSCSTEVDNYSNHEKDIDTRNVQTNYIEDVSASLGNKLSPDTENSFTGIPSNFPTNIADVDYSQAFTISSVSNMKSSIVVSLASIKTPNLYYVYSNIDGTYEYKGNVTISSNSAQTFGIGAFGDIQAYGGNGNNGGGPVGTGLSADGTCNYSNANGYWECVVQCTSCILDTNGFSGQVITVAALAGGAGCAGCGFAAAAIFAIAEIGCMAGC